jgi:tight adherence protein F
LLSNSYNKQKGAFLVEFAVLAASLSVFFLFTVDVMFKISAKGKLDRVSYSAVSIMKERTQLYDATFAMTSADTGLIYNVMEGSIRRTMGDFDELDFGILFEAQTYDTSGVKQDLVSIDEGNKQCEPKETLGQLEPQLKVETNWGRPASLYRVTVCYDTENFVAGVLGNGFTQVSSSAVIVGR